MEDRILGALIGFAVGDALGATTEFMSAKDIKTEYGVHKDITGGGWLDLKPGSITDDTEMMLCVARSLVQCTGFDAKDMADKCLAWYEDDPIDVGRTIRAGLHRYAKTGELERPASHDQAGNGALMRVLPVFLAKPQPTFSQVLQHAHLTHNNSKSDNCIYIYGGLLAQVMGGVNMEGLHEDLDALCNDIKEQRYLLPYDYNASGYVVNTLSTVLHCFFSTTSFEEALVKCVNLGGDADTNAAILGGLAGAYCGYEAIPKRWIEALDPDVLNELVNISRLISEVPR